MKYKIETKTKGAFNDDSLLKLLYMGVQNAQKKWLLYTSTKLEFNNLSICPPFQWTT